MPEVKSGRATVDEPVHTHRPALSARDPRLDTWRAFLMAHALLTRRLDEDLRAEDGLTLGEYSALLQVAEAPDRSLRMNQLADGIFLSRSGVTRLIDRLEADGLIARSTCTVGWPGLAGGPDRRRPRPPARGGRHPPARASTSISWRSFPAPSCERPAAARSERSASESGSTATRPAP